MNSEGTSTTTLIELIRELLVEMGEFIDKLPVELPEREHHDEFVFICLYRYAKELAFDLNLLIEATAIGAATYSSTGMHMLCRSLLVNCIDTYYIKRDPLKRAERYMDYIHFVAHPPINESKEIQKVKLDRFKQLYSKRINGKVRKPRTSDWSGLSTEEKIKEGIQLYFREENQNLISDSLLSFYKICCNHVHGNYIFGMYTASEPETEEQRQVKKERLLNYIGTCLFVCIKLIMENIYKLYQHNTEPIDNLWKRFVPLMD